MTEADSQTRRDHDADESIGAVLDWVRGRGAKPSSECIRSAIQAFASEWERYEHAGTDAMAAASLRDIEAVIRRLRDQY